MKHLCISTVFALSMCVGFVSSEAFAAEPLPNSFVYVCRDAGVGGYQAFPDIHRLPDGGLIVVFYAGYAHVSMPNEKWPKGGRVSYCTSYDEGHSWSEPRVLYDGPDDDRDPSIICLDDGRLICNFCILTPDETKTKNPWKSLGTWMTSSDDLGKTWSEPKRMYEGYYCSSQIRKLSDGRLIVGLYRQTPKFAAGAVGISDDGGKTWKPPRNIDNGGYRLEAETDVIELIDGSLFAIQRPKMCYSISKDRGNTWTVSRSIGFNGESPCFHRSRDGAIILSFRFPRAHATCMRISRDECKTWGHNILIDNVFGAYPSMIDLKDGSILVVYHETNIGGYSAIRAKRFRVKGDDVEWVIP